MCPVGICGATSLYKATGWQPTIDQLRNPSVEQQQLRAQVRSCWADMVAAIEAAQDFIYITGWSMHPETRLLRQGASGGVRIGELLKRKAAQKVNVCLLARPRFPSCAPPATVSRVVSACAVALLQTTRG